MDALDQLPPPDQGDKGREIKGCACQDQHGEPCGVGPVDSSLDPVERASQAGLSGPTRSVSTAGAPSRPQAPVEGGRPVIQAFPGVAVLLPVTRLQAVHEANAESHLMDL